MNKRVASSKKDLYNRFRTKILLYDFLLLIFIFLGIFLIRKSFSFIDPQNITYKETSNLDYKVRLKSNEFYETESLDKGMLYVASLIDKVDINFDYNFEIDRDSDIDFEYNIVAKLVISSNGDKSKTFFEKDYILLKNTKESLSNDKIHRINKDISIDYDYYNDLANKFRLKYGIDTSSNLIVYLNVHEKNGNNNKFVLDNMGVMSLTIPLSQKAINISMDYKEVNKTNKLVRNKEIFVNSYLKLVLGVLFLVIGLYFVYRYIRMLLKLRVKLSKYDKFIKKILNEYDRLIVETSTPPLLKGQNVIEINKFQELLDVRDNLRLPIKYYVLSKHRESNFYITHDDELYLYIVRACDFE